jgi:hypothetical protein
MDQEAVVVEPVDQHSTGHLAVVATAELDHNTA